MHNLPFANARGLLGRGSAGVHGDLRNEKVVPLVVDRFLIDSELTPDRVSGVVVALAGNTPIALVYQPTVPDDDEV